MDDVWEWNYTSWKEKTMRDKYYPSNADFQCFKVGLG